jgi:hypothetical protein
VSRRHRGRSRHAGGRSDDGLRPQAPIQPRPEPRRETTAEPRPAAQAFQVAAGTGPPASEQVTSIQPAAPYDGSPNGNGHAPHLSDAADMNGAARAGCTAPQLRRFIKSRPYVPMHELRRRFGINGAEDEVSALPIDEACVYVGLPERECRLLGELVRGGEVGYELSLDPRTPIVVGVYPMRPVPRA